MKKILSTILTVFTTLAFGACGKPNTKNADKITVYHTNDVHGRLEEGKYAGMGYAKIATIVKNARKENPDGVLLLDAGDTIHGQNIVNLNKGEAVVEIYNKLGYDALAVGNHEFDFGLDRILEIKEDAKFKVLAANVVYKSDKTSLFDHRTIFTKKGIKFGVFGLATPATPYTTHPENVKTLEFLDPIMVAKKQVAALKKENVDFIIGLTHIGIGGTNSDKSTDLAKQVEGIDLIVDGHSHTTKRHKVGKTLIVQTGDHSKNLGKVDIYFNKETKKVVSMQDELISKDSQKETKKDPAIEAIIQKYKTENESVTSVVVGSTTVMLDRTDVRTKETNIGNLIADSMRWNADADFALTNGGGIRTSIDQGPITYGEVIGVMPFGNINVKLEITGKQLKEVLKHAYSKAPESSGGFAQVSGLKVTYKKGGEIVSLTKTDGSVIKDDQKYTLATNDFLAAGGDKYEVLKGLKVVGTYSSMDKGFVDYINRYGADAKVEGRITRQ